MKISIINLPRFQGSSVTREGRCEFVCNFRVDTPATLLIIVSLLKNQNYHVDFIDANAQNKGYPYLKVLLRKWNPDCVIFTFNSWIVDYDLRICEFIKKINPNCKTIGYSWFARNFSKDILTKFAFLDVQIIEDPFSVIENLMNCINNKGDLGEIEGIAYRNYKEIKVNKKLTHKKNFGQLPLPAYNLIKSFKPYYLYTPLIKPYALVYAGSGCPFSCAYCPDANTKYSGRSAEEIIKELKILKELGKIRYVWFYDQIFTINRKRVIEFCKRLLEEKLKIYWFCDSRADLVDIDLLKLMKAAGCTGISYGIESGSQKILNNMKKSIEISQALNALKWTREAKIPIQLNLMVGYIGENKMTLKETENFIRSSLPDIMQISFVLAMNGSEFTSLAIKNNWINDTISWHEKIIDLRLDKNRYKPFQLNLPKEIKKLYRALYLNPQWWFNSLKTLINNHQLILPILGALFNRSKSIKIL